MDKATKQINSQIGDLAKGMFRLEDEINNGIRECKIFKYNVKLYLKDGGTITEDITKLSDRVDFILKELHSFKEEAFK